MFARSRPSFAKRGFKRKKQKKAILLHTALLMLLTVGLFYTGFFLYLHSEIKQRFESRRWSVPSRVFSATVPIYPGQTLALGQFKEMLEGRRYREAMEEPSRAGEYRVNRNILSVYLREFKFPGHSLPAQRVNIQFAQKRIEKIEGEQGPIAFLELEPVEITRLFGHERESRSLINIRQVPGELLDAIVCIEDRRFFEHKGMDFRGIFRALVADVKAGRVVQGGSTITQQLVKNYFLEPERNFRRKIMEASMALIVEAMYDKDEILEMYMNEIYLGQRGSVAIHGFGEAALHYFGRNVEDLTLAESALLAGMIRGPAVYSPVTHPEAALERRNTVLARMLELGKVNPAAYQRALSSPVRLAQNAMPVKAAPYFVDYVRQQLQELYEPSVLESEGLSIYTTLHPELAAAAENVVKLELEELERGMARRGAPSEPDNPLQAVLIAVHPKTGAVLALIGGRDYARSSFNRALLAHRQPGSSIKPFIYLSVLNDLTLASRVSDEPVKYKIDGTTWTPRNYNRRYHGSVSLRYALENSLNAATVDAAMKAGLPKVIQTLRDLGIRSTLEPYPSLALGAFEVTPLELSMAYAILDNDGQKPYFLSLREVVTETGEVQQRRNVDFVSVTSPAKAFLITSALQGAVERGTGKVLKAWGVDFPCAGKTGTTSDYRDSWFVGYTNDLLVAVWVGYDDNRATGLTGAAGAGRIWARFMREVRPWFQARPFKAPPGVVQRSVCVESGALAAFACPQRIMEYFLAERAPTDYCPIHGSSNSGADNTSESPF